MFIIAFPWYLSGCCDKTCDFPVEYGGTCRMGSYLHFGYTYNHSPTHHIQMNLNRICGGICMFSAFFLFDWSSFDAFRYLPLPISHSRSSILFLLFLNLSSRLFSSLSLYLSPLFHASFSHLINIAIHFTYFRTLSFEYLKFSDAPHSFVCLWNNVIPISQV